MECFTYPLDFFHTYMWERAHNKDVERGGPFKTDLDGDPITFKAGQDNVDDGLRRLVSTMSEQLKENKKGDK